jgi:PilZ domain
LAKQSIGDGVERRNASRYAVRAPVRFDWENMGRRQAAGFTRDLSSTGVFVLCSREDCPAFGTSVAMQIMLPPIHAEAHGITLRCDGRVVRVNSPEFVSGFAAIADFGV